MSTARIVGSVYQCCPLWGKVTLQNVSKSSATIPRRTLTSHLHYPLNTEPKTVIIHRLTAQFFAHCPSHPNPLVQNTGNYTPADLTDTYMKYKHKHNYAYSAIISLSDVTVFLWNISCPVFTFVCIYTSVYLFRLVKGTILLVVLEHAVHLIWNVMAHAQKPDFVFRRNEPVHLNRPAGASVQSTTGSRGVRISGSNAGYTMFRGSVKGTGYALHSPVSPSIPLSASSCAITFQLDSICFLCNKSVKQNRDISSALQAFIFITLFSSRIQSVPRCKHFPPRLFKDQT